MFSGASILSYSLTAFSPIPLFMWLPWIPSFLHAQARPEAPIMRACLQKIAEEYPQATFYPLSFYGTSMLFFLFNTMQLPQLIPPIT